MFEEKEIKKKMKFTIVNYLSSTKNPECLVYYFLFSSVLFFIPFRASFFIYFTFD